MGSISIHALRVEGDSVKNLARAFNMSISIHALRVEGDPCFRVGHYELSISIHALRVEGDIRKDFDLLQLCKFLSTPSGWRATGVHNIKD